MPDGETPAPTPGATSLTCIQLAERVKSEVSKSPKDVLSSVRLAMVDNDACACDIVKTAIKASDADNDLTGLIVEVAVKTKPSRFKEIVECAILANPAAKTQVRSALERVFGSKGSGKGGKVVVVQTVPRVVMKEIPQLFFPPLEFYPPPSQEVPPGDKPPGDKPPPPRHPPGGGDEPDATPTNPCHKPHPHPPYPDHPEW